MTEPERDTVWSRLIEPSRRIEGEEARSHARLLGTLTLVHPLVLLLGAALAEAIWRSTLGSSFLAGAPGGAVILAVFLILTAAAVLRAGRLRAAAALYLVPNVALPPATLLMIQPPQVWTLGSAMIPIVLAAMALRGRSALAVTVLTLGACALGLLWLPLDEDMLARGFGQLLVVLIASLLMLVLRHNYGVVAELRMRQLRESELALRGSEERLRALLSVSRDVIVVSDHTGARRAGYGAIEALTGESLGVQGALDRLDDIHADDSERVRREMTELLQRPGATIRSEWRQRHRDGSYRWIEALATNLVGTPGVDGVVMNVRDASERRAAEETLRRSEARYRTLFGAVTDAAFLLDEERRVLEVNDAACRRLGYQRQELIGAPIELIEVGSPDRARSELRERGHTVFEAAARCRDGSTYPVEVAATETEVDGAPAVLALARDITERRRAQAEQQQLQDQLLQAVKMESIGRLAGGVAHDFNNLLTAVLGNVDLAQHQLRQGQGVAELLEGIRQAGLSAAALTRQLLAFSRKQVIEPRFLDVNELIERMHRMLVRVIGETYELQLVQGKELGTVRADPGLLEQAILNLVVNARDAMPGGGVLTLETANVSLDREYQRTHPLVQPGPHVMLAISDTGVGMSEAVKARIFEPFFTTKPRGYGTGLGLATTYGAVRQSNGTIEVYSEPGRGSVFKIYLPVADDEPERLETPSREPPLSHSGRNQLVLVVEDDERVRGVAARALTALGYEVLVAPDGDHALSVAAERQEPIHLLLTDVVMPGMNGRALAEQLARVHPEAKVLYTSGYTESILDHHGVLDDGIEFLSKPYTVDALARRVRAILDGG